MHISSKLALAAIAFTNSAWSAPTTSSTTAIVASPLEARLYDSPVVGNRFDIGASVREHGHPTAPGADTPGGIPGYENMVIGLQAANKMQDVEHSAVAAAIEHTEKASYMEFDDTPINGKPYFHSFKGTNVTAARNFAEAHDAAVPFIFTNPTKHGMCILGSATNLLAAGEGNTFMFTPNATALNNMVYVSAKSIVQVGNFLPKGTGEFNGRMEVHYGCDKTCGNCRGPKTPINTLFEYTWIKHTVASQGAEEGFWSNLSNVDGLSSNVNITVYDSNDKICHGRAINTTAKEVKKECPKDLFWKDKHGNVGCSSECKHTGSDSHCCVGAFLNRCPPSSAFLKKLAPHAYSFATDDPTQVEVCKAPKAIHIEFSPIHQIM